MKLTWGEKLEKSIEHWENIIVCIENNKPFSFFANNCACCDYDSSNNPCHNSYIEMGCPILFITRRIACHHTPWINFHKTFYKKSKQPILKAALLELDFLNNIYYCIKSFKLLERI
jgi:hypothetical protein